MPASRNTSAFPFIRPSSHLTMPTISCDIAASLLLSRLEDCLETIDRLELGAGRRNIVGGPSRAFERHDDIREAARFAGVTEPLDRWHEAGPLLPQIGGCTSQRRLTSGDDAQFELPSVVIEHDDVDRDFGLELG